MTNTADVDEFIAITNSDRRTAEYYVEMSGNNLERAVDFFFEIGGIDVLDPPAQGQRQARPPAPQPTAHFDDDFQIPNGGFGGGRQGGFGGMPAGGFGGGIPAGGFGGGAPGGFGGGAPGGFGGGAPGGFGGGAPGGFGGPGRFGGVGVTAFADDNDFQPPRTNPVQPPPRVPVKKKITLWKNGFQIDNGKFRPKGEPANDLFLEEIAEGKIPTEIQKAGGQNDLELDNKIEQDYQTVLPTSSSSPQNKPVYTPKPSFPNPKELPPKYNFAFEGQESAQIKIPNKEGNLVSITVPLSASIIELRNYVIQARPDLFGEEIVMRVEPTKRVLSNYTTSVSAELLNNETLSISKQENIPDFF